MQFNDTSGKSGIIQKIEFWTAQTDGAISGDTTLMKQWTAWINQAFSRLMPRILSYTDHIRWDDINNPDIPVGTFNLVSGQSDYTVATDDNSLEILNITNVRIYPSASATVYLDLEKMSIDDERALDAMSPNPQSVGVPFAYLERGNTIFFYPQPNYSSTSGAKVYFERQQYVFLGDGTDNTKAPGIPSPFHELLALIPSHDWIIANKPDDTALITRMEAEIARQLSDLDKFISKRYPTRKKITTAFKRFR